MVIHTFWGWRKGENSPELLVAWDDFTYDGWPEGYEEAIARYSEPQVASEIPETRRIELFVPDGKIEAAFEPKAITAEVKNVH